MQKILYKNRGKSISCISIKIEETLFGFATYVKEGIFKNNYFVEKRKNLSVTHHTNYHEALAIKIQCILKNEKLGYIHKIKDLVI